VPQEQKLKKPPISPEMAAQPCSAGLRKAAQALL